MSKDPLDLPVRRTPTPATPSENRLPADRTRFTEQQVDTIVQSGARVAEGVVSIASGLMEIAHIRAQSAADVANIQARSEAMVKVLRAETEQMMVNRKSIRTRGEAAALVIEQVMKCIPEGDTEARRQALSMLPQLVRDVVVPSEAQSVR